MRILWNILLMAAVSLQFCGISFAKDVYLKDGGIIECESFWKRGGQIVVKVNRDVLLEFEPAAIDMSKTFRRVKHKPHQAKRRKTAVKAPHAMLVAAKGAAAESTTVTTPPHAAPAPVAASAPTAKPAVMETAAPSSPPAPAVAAAPAPTAPPGQALTKAELERRTRENAELMVEALRKKDPELMKKAMEAQNSLVQLQKESQKNRPPQPEPPWFKYFLMLGVSGVLVIIAMWVVFNKAGEQGIKSVVPFYNLYTLMEISGKPGWWLALLFIPVVGFVFYLLAMISLAGKFGRSALFGIGLVLLPMLFFPMLAFGGSKYELPPDLDFTFSDEPTQV